MPDEPKITDITRCPCCGGTKRFARDLAIEQELPNAEQFGLHQFGGPVADQKKMQTAMVGTKFPVIVALIDMCTEIRDDGIMCGCLYAYKVIEQVGRKSIQMPPGMMGPGQGPSAKPYNPFQLPPLGPRPGKG